MPHLVFHPAGRFERSDREGRFDVCFTRREMRALTWDMEDDIHRVLKPGMKPWERPTRFPPDLADAAFVTSANAEDERLTHIQRFHFTRYRLRSLVEILR